MIAFLWTAIALTAAADPCDSAVTLSWKAKTEQSTYGYIVYRSTSRGGPFRRASPIIRTFARTDEKREGEISTYRWQDTETANATEYFYYLDSIGFDGVKTRFSGVLSKVANCQPKG